MLTNQFQFQTLVDVVDDTIENDWFNHSLNIIIVAVLNKLLRQS